MEIIEWKLVILERLPSLSGFRELRLSCFSHQLRCLCCRCSFDFIQLNDPLLRSLKIHFAILDVDVKELYETQLRHMLEEVLHELRYDIVERNLDELSKSNAFAILCVVIIMCQSEDVLLLLLLDLQVLDQVVVVVE